MPHENLLPATERRLGLPADMDLPQELIDKIIDAVWDADDSTLDPTRRPKRPHSSQGRGSTEVSITYSTAFNSPLSATSSDVGVTS
jgi:hypothetical protein